ncbi:MAG: YbaN family protein, partial [Actinomycetes bacterium]
MTDPAAPTPAPVVRSGLSRVVWLAVGMVAVGLGGIGIVVPGLPTTVFFIVAASCFARSSPRFEQWVLDLPRIGPLVRDHRAGLGMPRRVKVVALSMMWAAILLSGLALR